ncbi:MAG: sulfatase-like hydrolase/transferase, partial [Gammaproteobacteria bacterium]
MYPNQMNFMPEGKGMNYTPNLDRLASEGTIMRNQHVTSPVCTPSRYSVLTGRYASRSQAPAFLSTTQQSGQSVIQWNSYVEPTREKTIAHLLSDSGYRTGFVGKDHVIYTPGRQPLSRSSNVEDPEIQKIMKENRVVTETAIHRAGFEYVDRVYPNNPDYNGSMTLAVHNQDWITEGALNFLDTEDDRPFFLYFATTIPHIPQDDHRTWNADRKATPNGWLENAPDVQPDSDSIARRAREHNVEGRETMIWLDDAIGALLTKLETTGELDNTIIFFFNDHGQSSKGARYQGGAHNPSIVWRQERWPVGQETPALVSNIDFTPTILELAGVPRLDHIDGVSFLPILQNRTNAVRDSLFFEIGYTRAVLKDDYKYLAIRYPEAIKSMTLEQRQERLDNM